MKGKFLSLSLLLCAALLWAAPLFATEQIRSELEEEEVVVLKLEKMSDSSSELEKTKEAFVIVGNGIVEGAITVGAGIKMKALAMARAFEKAGKATRDFLMPNKSEDI